MHAIEKYIERRERERRERERKKVGFSPIGKREEEGVLTDRNQISLDLDQDSRRKIEEEKKTRDMHVLFCLLFAEKWRPQLHVIVFFNIIYFFDDPWHCLALRILFHFTSSNGAVDIIFHHSSKRGRERCIMPLMQCLIQYQSHSRQLFA